MNSAPIPPTAFDILPDPGHCWGRGAFCGLEEERTIGDLELGCVSRPQGCRGLGAKASPLRTSSKLAARECPTPSGGGG